MGIQYSLHTAAVLSLALIIVVLSCSSLGLICSIVIFLLLSALEVTSIQMLTSCRKRMMLILSCIKSFATLDSRYASIEMEIRPSNSLVLWSESHQLHELVKEKMKEFQMSLKKSLHITSAPLSFEICHIL